MDIAIPTIPAGILTLLSLAAPYLVAIINRPEWTAATKKIVAIIAAIILAAAVMAFYYWSTGDPIPSWPALILLAIVVMQASHALLTKSSARRVEYATQKRIAKGGDR